MTVSPLLRRWPAPLAAFAIVGGLFALNRPPRLADTEAAALAGRFAFEKRPLAELPGYERKQVRSVHPSLEHLSTQISFVGAAATLGDLDGDGLPNDVLHVDPRVDLIVVAPLPKTGRRFRPFVLQPSPLPYSPATMAPMGSLLGDFDEDGLLDILAYYWGRSPVLFLRSPLDSGGEARPRAEAFSPVELVEPPERWYTSACTQADLDGDGRVDLIVGNYFADEARILDASAPGREAMPDSISRAFNGGRNRLLLSQADAASSGGRLFREAVGALEQDVACGWTLAVGTADLDGDLLPEIYFVQDWGPDRLLHNRSQPGRLRFELLHGERTATTPASKVLGRDSFNGMGVDFGDLNGDGWPDLFVSNITCPFGLFESHFLFLSTGETARMRSGTAPYRDASESWGVARSGWTWDVRLADFDNDGVLEAMQAAGFAKGDADRWPEYQETALVNDQLIRDPRIWPRIQPGDRVSGGDSNPFFVRAADGRYYDLARWLGLAEPINSRGLATADVDGDGRLDFVAANQWEQSFLFRNTAREPGAFLGLCLRLPLSTAARRSLSVRAGHPSAERDGATRPAIGATAAVKLPDGRRLVGQVDGGNGHSGKRSPELHFGLGRVDASARLSVELRWLSAQGEVRRHSLRLSPGWHTVVLGESSADRQDGRP